MEHAIHAFFGFLRRYISTASLLERQTVPYQKERLRHTDFIGDLDISIPGLSKLEESLIFQQKDAQTGSKTCSSTCYSNTGSEAL